MYVCSCVRSWNATSSTVRYGPTSGVYTETAVGQVVDFVDPNTFHLGQHKLEPSAHLSPHTAARMYTDRFRSHFFVRAMMYAQCVTSTMC